MSETEELIDLGYKRSAAQMVGQDFQALLLDMQSRGYSGGKIVSNRKDGTGTVTITKGHHESRMQYVVTFNWRERIRGIKEPDKVISSKWIKPLRPEPFEVR